LLKIILLGFLGYCSRLVIRMSMNVLIEIIEFVPKEKMTELFVVNSLCKVNTKGISKVGKLK
jgi:hypothetical protein